MGMTVHTPESKEIADLKSELARKNKTIRMLGMLLAAALATALPTISWLELDRQERIEEAKIQDGNLNSLRQIAYVNSMGTDLEVLIGGQRLAMYQLVGKHDSLACVPMQMNKDGMTLDLGYGDNTPALGQVTRVVRR
jgi:hypothetical protein